MKRWTVLVASAALLVAACGGTSETIAEKLVEAGEGVSDVEFDDGDVTVEFDDSQGGGSIVLGGGSVPSALPIPVPDGGDVQSAIERGSTAAAVLGYPLDRFAELVSFYSSWLDGQIVEGIARANSTNPQSESWFGEIAGTPFAITVTEGFGIDGNPAAIVTLTWGT